MHSNIQKQVELEQNEDGRHDDSHFEFVFIPVCSDLVGLKATGTSDLKSIEIKNFQWYSHRI